MLMSAPSLAIRTETERPIPELDLCESLEAHIISNTHSPPVMRTFLSSNFPEPTYSTNLPQDSSLVDSLGGFIFFSNLIIFCKLQGLYLRIKDHVYSPWLCLSLN